MLILLKKTGALSLKVRLFWDTVTKTTSSDLVSGSNSYIRGSGTYSFYDILIDAYEVGTSVILAYWVNATQSMLFVTFANTKLLLLKNDSTGLIKYVTIFNVLSKTYDTYERFHGDTNITEFKAFDNNYTRSTTDILASLCVGLNQNTWLSDGVGGVSKSVIYNSAACGFLVATSGTVVTESIVIKLDNECKENPIYLRWLNTLGGYDHFMFHFTNEVVYDTKDLGQFEKTYTNLSAKTINYTRGKKAIKTIIAGAEGLSQNDYNGIFPDLFLSPNINIVTIGGVETPVQITEGSWSMNARDTMHSIEFELELPEYFTITQ